jgi:hypothetical protein
MLQCVNINSCLPIKTVSLLYVTETLRCVTFLMAPVRFHRTLLSEPWFHGKALFGRIALVPQIILVVRNQYIRA